MPRKGLGSQSFPIIPLMLLSFYSSLSLPTLHFFTFLLPNFYCTINFY